MVIGLIELSEGGFQYPGRGKGKAKEGREVASYGKWFVGYHSCGGAASPRGKSRRAKERRGGGRKRRKGERTAKRAKGTILGDEQAKKTIIKKPINSKPAIKEGAPECPEGSPSRTDRTER